MKDCFLKVGHARFKPGYEPVKYQFATAPTGPWHDAMEANDKYRRDSLDGGTTWGEPYQFRGTDGRPGSDANVTYDNIKAALQKAALTKTTFITADEMGAPIIYGGEIYGSKFCAGLGDDDGTYGKFADGALAFYWGDSAYPKAAIGCPSGSLPYIRLGEGSDPNSPIKNSFWVIKGPTDTEILYTDNKHKQSGFKLKSDGVIEVIGNMQVSAVWAD